MRIVLQGVAAALRPPVPFADKKKKKRNKKTTNSGLHRRRHIVEGDALYITIITSRCPRCYFSSIILVMARWRGVSKYLWRFLRFTLQADTDGWPNISPTFHPLDPRFHNLFQFCFGLFPSFPARVSAAERLSAVVEGKFIVG